MVYGVKYSLVLAVSLDWTQFVPTPQYIQQQGRCQFLPLHPLKHNIFQITGIQQTGRLKHNPDKELTVIDLAG